MKSQLIFTSLFVLLLASSSFGQLDNTFSIDNSHSIIDFRASHRGFGAVRGTFENYSGTIIYDEKSIENLSATFAIEVASISTRHEGRDWVLKEQFFEAEKFPVILFQSTKVIKEGDRHFVEGNLKIRDKSKKMRIPFEITAELGIDQWMHKRIAFAGQFTINRRDFDLFYRDNDFWDGIVSDSIQLDFELGAFVYNAIETIFPIRDKFISKRILDIWEKEGPDAAKETGKKILESEEQNWNTHINRMWRIALMLAQSGKLEDAIGFCDLTTELYATIAEPAEIADMYAYKALFQMELDQKEAARQSLKKALEIDAFNSMAQELMR